ncbi:MAG: Fic family protein [Solirubrobacteraceae bacterium]
MPTAWEDPPGSEARIAANAQRVLAGIAATADERLPPSIATAQQWHRDLYDGVARPFDYYAGEVRDSDDHFPDLIGYEVKVGSSPGVPSREVPAALESFERAARTAAVGLDLAIPVGAHPSTLEPRQLHGVLTYCAVLHGEWVRIHPFANGNGRTARLWANWAALRYGLPPFVTVKPRPANPYGAAAMASMGGDHQVTLAVFDQMLREFLAGLQTP